MYNFYLKLIKNTFTVIIRHFNSQCVLSCVLNIRETIDLCQKAEHAGVSWITVHGRTAEQRSEPSNLEIIKLVCHLYIFTNIYWKKLY